MERKKVTIHTLQKRKEKSHPIVMLTAYDYLGAKVVDSSDVDIILVGDSLGMVMLGYDSTVAVTLDEMLHHCRAVARGTKYAFTVGDMTFGSYEISEAKAVENAIRLLQEGQMQSVKLEGGQEMASTISAISRAGIPVMGHIGLTPQSVSKLGGYRVQGKTAVSARRLVDDALALEDAGCFAIVLEAVPAEVAEVISQRLRIPTIGIGAGAGCDGQVLVFHDMLGWLEHTPKFVHRYANLAHEIKKAVDQYSEEVRSQKFPALEHTYPMAECERQIFLENLPVK